MCRNRNAFSTSVIVCLLLAGALPSLAIADEPAEHDHTHAAAPANVQSATGSTMSWMQKMRAMHEEMLAAKTPAEWQALMAEHTRAMQEAMISMQQMMSSSNKGTTSLQMMEMRMDMMTTMMQMIVDQQNARQHAHGRDCACP